MENSEDFKNWLLQVTEKLKDLQRISSFFTQTDIGRAQVILGNTAFENDLFLVTLNRGGGDDIVPMLTELGIDFTTDDNTPDARQEYVRFSYGGIEFHYLRERVKTDAT